MILSYFPRWLLNISRGYAGSLKKLAEAGLKLKPSQCELFHTQLNYLGHVVSKAGVKRDPKKVIAIVNWLHPVTDFWDSPISPAVYS